MAFFSSSSRSTLSTNCVSSCAATPLAKYQDAQAVFDQLQFGLLAGHDGPGIELPMAGLAFEDAVTSV
jgi:hypothetical protein